MSSKVILFLFSSYFLLLNAATSEKSVIGRWKGAAQPPPLVRSRSNRQAEPDDDPPDISEEDPKPPLCDFTHKVNCFLGEHKCLFNFTEPDGPQQLSVLCRLKKFVMVANASKPTKKSTEACWTYEKPKESRPISKTECKVFQYYFDDDCTPSYNNTCRLCFTRKSLQPCRAYGEVGEVPPTMEAPTTSMKKITSEKLSACKANKFEFSVRSCSSWMLFASVSAVIGFVITVILLVLIWKAKMTLKELANRKPPAKLSQKQSVRDLSDSGSPIRTISSSTRRPKKTTSNRSTSVRQSEKSLD